MQDLVIQQADSKKGRVFGATQVALVTADGLFPEGASGETIRPVWAMFAGTEAELRPFIANLRTGRKAEKPSNYSRRGNNSERLEFLKSVGYQVAWQKETEGCLVTLYHPDLFRLDPGMVDPDGISFVLLVPSAWSAAQNLDPATAVEHVQNIGCPVDESLNLEALVPTAHLFAAYLDRRTRCPILADGRFYLQLFLSALDKRLASFPGDNFRWNAYDRDAWGYNHLHGFNAQDLDKVGILHAISLRSPHEEFEAFLAEEVRIFFEHTDRESFDFIPLSSLLAQEVG